MLKLFSKLARNKYAVETLAKKSVGKSDIASEKSPQKSQKRKFEQPLRTRYFYRNLSGGWTETENEIPIKKYFALLG